MSGFNENDLVIYKNNKKVMSGGYEVNSLLLNDNLSAIHNENNGTQVGGEKVSNLFSNMAIPAGLLMIQEANKVSHYETMYHDEMFDNSLYEKLLEHVSPKQRKLYNKRTRRSNNIYNKKSRKNKR
jgi:hypothetical protein